MHELKNLLGSCSSLNREEIFLKSLHKDLPIRLIDQTSVTFSLPTPTTKENTCKENDK